MCLVKTVANKAARFDWPDTPAGHVVCAAQGRDAAALAAPLLPEPSAHVVAVLAPLCHASSSVQQHLFALCALVPASCIDYIWGYMSRG